MLKLHNKYRLWRFDLNKLSNCKFCNKSFKPKSIGGHTKFCELNPDRLSHIEKLSFARSSITLETRQKQSESAKKSHREGAYKNKTYSKARQKWSDEQKKKLSEKRKAWLAANPDKHPWKTNSKFVSEPCQNLKYALANAGIDFIAEYAPLPDRFFAIDIAFPAVKIGIEVNGEQHYNRDGSLKKYYQDRHNLIEATGWKIFEIHYHACYNDEKTKEIVNSLLNLHEIDDIENLSFDNPKRSNQKHESASSQKKFISQQAYFDSQKLSEESLQKWKDAIRITDTSKFGFISKIAKTMNCSHTHVRRILNKYFPDIKSFQRKSI